MRRKVRVGKKLRTVLRSFEGEYVDGVYQDSEPMELEIWGNVQPATESNKTFYLKEGERAKEAIWFSMDERIYMPSTAVEGKLIKADVIFYDDAYWEVKGVKHWANETLPHTEGVAIRLTNSPRERIKENSTW